MTKNTQWNRKRFVSMLAASAMLLSMGLTGCKDNSTSPADSVDPAPSQNTERAASGDKHQVSIVLKTTASEYWSYVIAGIKQAEKDLENVEVGVYGASGDTAFDEQMSAVETLIGAGAMEAIAVAPLNAGMISQQLETVNFPVLAIDTNFDVASTFIGTAHEDASYQGGKYIAEQIGEGGKVVVLANIQGEPTSEARVLGYLKALEEGGCEVVATLYTEGVTDKAVAAMEQALQSQKEIDAVVCCADDVAIGASRAVKNSSRAGEGILICGFDGISSGVKAVVDGDISCTVAQDPYNMGYQCVVSLVEAIEGKNLDSFLDTGCTVITPENAKAYLKKLNSLV